MSKPRVTADEQQELRSWELMQACARVMLIRGYDKQIKSGTESGATVDQCVCLAFDGDWSAFKEWAMAYAESGCGVAG